jgi:hypothetical protein
LDSQISERGILTARESGTRSLCSNGAGDTDPSPMPITLRTDKIEPTAAAMLFLKRKSSLYLPKLESCQFVALIAAAMVSAQDIEGFLIATFGNKPSYVISISGGVAKM